MEIPKHLQERAAQAIDSLLTVQEAAKILETYNVGALLVMEGSKLVGLLSERDIALKVAAKDSQASAVLVEEIMTRKVISVSKSDSIEYALELMEKHHIRHLPLLDAERVMAMISFRDLYKIQITLLDRENRNLAWFLSAQEKDMANNKADEETQLLNEARNPK